jgi:preprotein translocase subunit YajC
MWFTIIWLLALVVTFWLFVIRPQRTMRRRAAELRRSVDVGDQVVTVGGLYGEVVAIADDEIRLEVAPEVVVRFARRAIAGKVADRAGGAPEAAGEEEGTAAGAAAPTP